MAYLDPVAGKAREGKPAAAVTNAAAATAAAAAGATPTKAEYDALLADVNTLRTKLNQALTSLRAAGVIAP
ncbi:hypothetical protein GTX53_24430 [Streptomyces sp. SID5594]|uniref:hypothetical protein n=1 Tax=unclassified Streptomyces TaxID=2593676 RepID=UPI00036794CB|nr:MULTISPECIES: hypothetical protein [unclassified Streptomyces]MZF56940.1 hypothetical protein [Streptomyces sp. SID5594]